MTISSGLSAVIGFGYWAVAAWKYDAASVGSNSAAISMMVLAAAVAALNLSSAMVRFVPTAGRRTRRLVAVAFIVSTCLAVVIATAAVLVVRVIAPGAAFLTGVTPMVMFVVGTAGYALFVIQNGVLVGLQRAELVPVINVVFAVAKVGLVVAFVAAMPLHGIFASWVLSMWVLVIVVGIYLFGWAIPRHQRLRETDDLPPVRQIGRFVAFDYAGSISSIGSIDLMPIMVIAVLGAAPNAYFAIAWVIAYSLHLLNTNMGTSLVAETAANPGRLAGSVRHVLGHTSKLLVPVVITTMAAAPLLLGIFGPGYQEATDTLRLLALAAIPNLVVTTAVSSARAQRRLGLLLSIQLTQCGIVLSLTWVLLHIAGLTGAGLAWLISQTVMAVYLLVRRDQWMTNADTARPDTRKRRRHPMLPATAIVWVLQLLTTLRLHTVVDRSLGLLRRRRSSHSRSFDAAWLAVLDETTSGCTTAQPVRTVSDVDVAILRSKCGEPYAVAKIANGALGTRELSTQRVILHRLSTDDRLAELHQLLPRVLAFRETPRGITSLETYRPGVSLADAVMGRRDHAPSLTAGALAAIGLLHRQTGTVTLIDDAALHDWVGEPLAALADICVRMDPRLLSNVDHVGELLCGALMQRRALVSWTHGDFTPDNIQLDAQTGAVTGIVDWGGARPGRLALLDSYLLILGVSRMLEARELGDIVRRRLRSGGLNPLERQSLRASYHSSETATPRCDRLDEEALILLTWLHHAAEMWRKCVTYQEHRIWWAANIAPVLRAVVTSTSRTTVAPRPRWRRRSTVPACVGPATPTVAVVICAYTEDRWTELTSAVESVRAQTVSANEIIVVIDHCASLFHRADAAFRDITVIENAQRAGLSGARNTGARTARSDVVAFLDDDAVAAPDWIASLIEPYANPHVLGVGGYVRANWHQGRPNWFPAEFDWVVGCSYHGMPDERSVIRNFIGANMSLRRELLMESGGFDTRLGRVGTRPVGCEETELCIRVQRDNPNGIHVYEPSAHVLHAVPASRGTWSYYRARCFAEGLSKAKMGSTTPASQALSTERRYLTSTLPFAFLRYVGQAFRGHPSALSSAFALIAGVMITGLGYTVGYAQRAVAKATATDAKRSRRRLHGAAAMIPVCGAAALWLVSLPRIRLDRIGDLGLVPLFPVTFWAALAVLLVGYAVLVLRGAIHPWMLNGYLGVLVVILHATPCVLYDALRYSWAWKHVGVIDFFVRNEGVDSSIRELGVYQRWPGFFTLNATMIEASGLRGALAYAEWAPPLFGVLMLGPVYLIARTFTDDRRLLWTVLVVFVLANWVGQDYFAPQPTVFFLYLTAIALCLRYRAPRGAGETVGRRRDLLIGAAVILMVVAIAPTHQLTPLMTVLALAVLALCRYRVKTILLVAILAAVGWDVLFAWPWIAENLAGLIDKLGAPGENARSGFINLGDASPSQVVVAKIDRLHSGAIGLLALIGFVRRVRHHRELTLALLVIAPVPVVAINDYDGEMVFRIYLFSLPFLCFYAAAAFFPTKRAGQTFFTWIGLPAVLLLLIPGFLVSYYGKEQANYFSSGEAGASVFVYGIAPRGSLIIGATRDFPWAFMNYEFYTYERFGLLEPEDRQAILDDPVGGFDELMTPYHHAYLVLTRSQIADVEMIGAMPTGSIAALTETVIGSPRFTVIYRTDDAVVLTLSQPVREEGAM
ncbi:glycosyltransferase [Mycolicibacterium sp. XJ662]